jgi:hypothetical protein
VVGGEFVREEEKAAMRRSDEAVRKYDVLDFPVTAFIRDVKRTIGTKRSHSTGVDYGSVGLRCQRTAIEGVMPSEAAQKGLEAKLPVRGGETRSYGRPPRACSE